jgi:arsenate reductase
MKQILILCTGNSCRSIIAEALVNAKLDNIKAKSAGVKASGKVNINAKKILIQNNIWDDMYHSKTIDAFIDKKFDLIVTVCNNAYETCPVFSNLIPQLHINFQDPNGKNFEAFVKTYHEIKTILLPAIIKKIASH